MNDTFVMDTAGNGKPSPISIVIADNQRICLEGLRLMLSGEADFHIVGEAEHGDQALEITRKLAPTVLLISLESRSPSTIDVIRLLARQNSVSRFLAVVSHPEPQAIGELLRVGAAGVISKGCGFSEFSRAIRAVASKRIHVSPDIADALLTSYVLGNQLESDGNGGGKELSRREREVLQMVADGMTTKLVASNLRISKKTVDMHRQRIMDKLKIHGVAELTKYAIRAGLVRLD